MGNTNKETDYSLTLSLFKIMKRFIVIEFIIVVLLILAIVGQGIYHDYKWSEFDSIVVDGNDGGNANFIGNDGDVNNYGEDSSSQETER